MTTLTFNTPITLTAAITSTDAQANANSNANIRQNGSGNRAPLPPLLSGALALASRDLVFFVVCHQVAFPEN